MHKYTTTSTILNTHVIIHDTFLDDATVFSSLLCRGSTPFNSSVSRRPVTRFLPTTCPHIIWIVSPLIWTTHGTIPFRTPVFVDERDGFYIYNYKTSVFFSIYIYSNNYFICNLLS